MNSGLDSPDETHEELMQATPESSNNNIHVNIIDPPNWDGDASDIKDIGKTFGKRISNWGPILTIILTVTVSFYIINSHFKFLYTLFRLVYVRLSYCQS